MERKKVLNDVLAKKRVLVAPLDWGLGHATRCIPLVRELLSRNADVILAADGRPYDLLKREFPSIPIVRLPGFAVRYSEQGDIVLGMLRQLPGIASSVFREHRTLKTMIRDFRIDAVISDNRFGLFARSIPCVYVTHQIAIIMPRSLKWISPIVLSLHKLIIRQYDECWIPDYSGNENLSGTLSHGFPLPKNAHYIGPLTRFKKGPDGRTEYDVLAALSGPEPQRTIFESMIIEQLKEMRCKSLVVRGIPEKNQHIRISDSLSVVSFLESEALNKAMQASEIILARPGYSTLMDLAVLGKQAILVPTPGQTEQEYLAGELRKKDEFYVHGQEHFVLEDAIAQARKKPGFSRKPSSEHLIKEAVQRLMLMTNLGESLTQQ